MIKADLIANWKANLNARILIANVLDNERIEEGTLLEVSPSGDCLKLVDHKGEHHWKLSRKYNFLERLDQPASSIVATPSSCPDPACDSWSAMKTKILAASATVGGKTKEKAATEAEDKRLKQQKKLDAKSFAQSTKWRATRKRNLESQAQAAAVTAQVDNDALAVAAKNQTMKSPFSSVTKALQEEAQHIVDVQAGRPGNPKFYDVLATPEALEMALHTMALIRHAKDKNAT